MPTDQAICLYTKLNYMMFPGKTLIEIYIKKFCYITFFKRLICEAGNVVVKFCLPRFKDNIFVLFFVLYQAVVHNFFKKI